MPVYTPLLVPFPRIKNKFLARRLITETEFEIHSLEIQMKIPESDEQFAWLEAERKCQVGKLEVLRSGLTKEELENQLEVCGILDESGTWLNRFRTSLIFLAVRLLRLEGCP